MTKHDDPCIKICKFDAAGLCIGCHRTKAEVKGWKRMEPEVRTAILARIAPLMPGPRASKKLRKLDKRIFKLERKLRKLNKRKARLGFPVPVAAT